MIVLCQICLGRSKILWLAVRTYLEPITVPVPLEFLLPVDMNRQPTLLYGNYSLLPIGKVVWAKVQIWLAIQGYTTTDGGSSYSYTGTTISFFFGLFNLFCFILGLLSSSLSDEVITTCFYFYFFFLVGMGSSHISYLLKSEKNGSYVKRTSGALYLFWMDCSLPFLFKFKSINPSIEFYAESTPYL